MPCTREGYLILAYRGKQTHPPLRPSGNFQSTTHAMLQLAAAFVGLLPGAAHRRPARPAQLARASRPAMAESLTERLMSTLPTEEQTGGAELLTHSYSYSCLPPTTATIAPAFLLVLVQAPVVRAPTSRCSASTRRGRSSRRAKWRGRGRSSHPARRPPRRTTTSGSVCDHISESYRIHRSGIVTSYEYSGYRTPLRL